jgi:tRNA-dihydrouridine synthase B
MSSAQNLGVSPAITIGPIRLEGRALLAPMSGISDLAMRRIARRFGASLVFSEMVAAETFLRGETEASVRAEGEGLSPHAVQIVGCEAGALAETACRVVDAGAVLVDINMGCPSRRVSGALAGAALMRDLDNAERLIATVVKAVSVPVTVKMRLGWDETSLNAPELARRAERAGAQMATVHGRTRSQFYDGRADWAAVRAVVSSVAIPVVVNGDCATAEDARTMLALSGAAGVMIGRAAVGAPWLVGALGRALDQGGLVREPSSEERREAALEHLDWLVCKLGPRTGLRHARKHVAAYADQAGTHAMLRRELVTSEDVVQVRRLLADAFDANGARQAA